MLGAPVLVAAPVPGVLVQFAQRRIDVQRGEPAKQLPRHRHEPLDRALVGAAADPARIDEHAVVLGRLAQSAVDQLPQLLAVAQPLVGCRCRASRAAGKQRRDHLVEPLTLHHGAVSIEAQLGESTQVPPHRLALAPLAALTTGESR